MKKLSILLLLLGSLLLSAALLTAAPTALTIPWQVVGSGGGDSSDGAFAVSGTIGQGITAVSNDSTLNLSSGYWNGTSGNHSVYLPVVIK